MATGTVKRPILEADKEVSSGPMRPYLGKIKVGFGKHREILLNQKGCQFESTLGSGPFLYMHRMLISKILSNKIILFDPHNSPVN